MIVVFLAALVIGGMIIGSAFREPSDNAAALRVFAGLSLILLTGLVAL